MCRQGDDDWTVLSRKKAECALEQWLANKDAALNSLARWQLDIGELPSLQVLVAWHEDSVCEPPTGHRMEPDGTGPDGAPSWLRSLHLI